MGKSLAMQGETEGAFHFFEYAMELGSKDVRLYKDAIQVYYQEGQFAIAAKEISVRDMQEMANDAVFAKEFKTKLRDSDAELLAQMARAKTPRRLISTTRLK